jgi:acetoin utilization deacetylase AcuC-like enzyme
VTTAIYYDPLFLAHDTGDHPENKARLTAIVSALRAAPFAARLVWPSFHPISVTQAERIHAPAYLRRTEEAILKGRGSLDPDTLVSPDSWSAALLAAGAVVDAVRRVTAGDFANAFCAVRPPGHHAERTHAMGFCLINNVAVAARYALDELGLARIAIVDFDVHHGNGVQNSFYEEPRVFYVSTHQWRHYPGTGYADETGAGEGIGTTLNLPMEAGAGDPQMVAAFAGIIGPTLKKYAPELILVSAGFDAHASDPLGGMTMTTDGFAAITNLLVDLAADLGHGRLVSTLEGGYDLTALAECVVAHVGALARGA